MKNKIKKIKTKSTSASVAGFQSKRGLASSNLSNNGTGGDQIKKERSSLKKTSWRKNTNINNVTLEKKKQADYEIELQNKKRRRLSRKRRRHKTYLLLSMVLILYLMIVNLSSNRNQVAVDIQTLGQSYADSGYVVGLKSAAGHEFSSSLSSKIIHPVRRADKFKSGFSKAHPEVSAIKYDFDWLRMRSVINIELNIPLVSWVSPDGDKVSYVNQKGQIFDPPGELIELFQPLSIKGSGLGVQQGSGQLAPSSKLTWAVGVLQVLKSSGVEPVSINIDAQSFKGVEVILPTGQAATTPEQPTQEIRLLFSIEEDIERSGQSAARAVKHLQANREGGLAGLSYIDVRTPARIVYK